jgi:hypothetical protein
MDMPQVWRGYGSSTAAVLLLLASAQVECADTANACSRLEAFANDFVPLIYAILTFTALSETRVCDERKDA